MATFASELHAELFANDNDDDTSSTHNHSALVASVIGVKSKQQEDQDQDDQDQDHITEQVDAAFQSVHRGRFLPSYRFYCSQDEFKADYLTQYLELSNADYLQLVYRNRPFMLPGHPAHQSAPSLYHQALVALQLNNTDSFLQIGSGTGYLQTLASRLMGPDSICHGIESNEALVLFSRQASARYRTTAVATTAVATAAATTTTVATTAAKSTLQNTSCMPEFFHGDGFLIDSVRNIKYDKIYIAGGCQVEDQEHFLKLLKPGGCMVGPFGSSFLKLQLGVDGTLTEDVLCGVQFKSLEKSDPSKMIVLRPYMFDVLRFKEANNRFKDATRAVLMLSRRGRGKHRGGLPGMLPQFVWLRLLQFCARDWFASELDLMKLHVVKLQQKNLVLQDRCAEIKTDRDKYYHMSMMLTRQLEQGEEEEEEEEDEETEEHKENEEEGATLFAP